MWDGWGTGCPCIPRSPPCEEEEHKAGMGRWGVGDGSYHSRVTQVLKSEKFCCLPSAPTFVFEGSRIIWVEWYSV